MKDADRNKLNMSICSKLINKMTMNGWKARFADDENILNWPTAKQVDMIFNLDGADILFTKGKLEHAVMFTPYNTGIECIADWSYTEGDPDGFNAIMEAFEAANPMPE